MKIENWDLTISYWSTLNYHITPKRYWSHPSGNPPITRDPNRQFSSRLDKRSCVPVEQVTPQGTMFTLNWWPTSNAVSVPLPLPLPTATFSHFHCSLNKTNPPSFFPHRGSLSGSLRFCYQMRTYTHACQPFSQRTASFCFLNQLFLGIILPPPQSSNSIPNLLRNPVHFSSLLIALK